MALALVHPLVRPAEREVLEFDCGVRAYAPVAAGDYWRLRWDEGGRRRDTTAADRAAAIAKATELVERLGRGTPTDLARATGAELVAHYLDPTRRPPRTTRWSERHRDEQVRYCRLYVEPVIGAMACRRLSRGDFQAVVDQAPTPSVGAHLVRCVTAMVNAGLDEGYLLARQDVLRGVRWRAPADEADIDDEAADHAVTPDEIPTTDAVHALARAAAEVRGVWWRELEILLVAYSGLRWGEHAALEAAQLDIGRRRIRVTRQLVETRAGLKLTLPKGRRRRVTVFPATTPGGVDLAALVARRLAEVGENGLLFPAAQGGWARRSNYGRNVWAPAAVAAGWPRRADGRWAWTFHSLRHVFATWALGRPGVSIEDVSRFMGHSSVRVTQDIYIHVDSDAYDRFHAATR